MKGSVLNGPSFSLSVNKIHFNSALLRNQKRTTDESPQMSRVQRSQTPPMIPAAQVQQATTESKNTTEEQRHEEELAEQTQSQAQAQQQKAILSRSQSPIPTTTDDHNTARLSDNFKIRNLLSNFPLQYRIPIT